MMTRAMCHQPQVELDAAVPFLCMRLMSSQNQDEVELVKNELLKAGIASETRCHPMAEALGVSGVELWVQDERDFFDASKLYARMQERAAGRSRGAATKAKGEVTEGCMGVAKPDGPPYSSSNWDVNGLEAKLANEPRREELKQASSLLEKGIEEMFLRQSELAGECATLRSQVGELSKALAQAQADLALEGESRTVAERNQAEQISGLVGILERERQQWQQQLKSREDSLKNAQEKLDSMSRLLQNQQAAAVDLKEQIVSLELQRDENEISLAKARAEALAEREARIAADERAEKASLAQEYLEQELLNYAHLEQQIQAQVANLSSLCRKGDTKITQRKLQSRQETAASQR